jgi:hypothetical protein
MLNLYRMQAGVFAENNENILDFYTNPKVAESLVKNLLGRWESADVDLDNFSPIKVKIDFDGLNLAEFEVAQQQPANQKPTAAHLEDSPESSPGIDLISSSNYETDGKGFDSFN